MEVTHSLLGWIGVIEAYNEFAFVHLGEILVQHGCFGMSDVEITARLRRETSHYLAWDGVLEAQRERRSRFGARTRFHDFGIKE
jgi:hypothetical protein